MSQATILVDKYSKAAFKIAKANGLGAVFVKDLEIFWQNISPILKEITNPTISKTEIAKIVEEINKKLNINSAVNLFLINLAKSRRLNLLNKIQEKLEKMVKKDNNILQVELISAQKLGQDQIDQIKEILKKGYPQKEIEVAEVLQKDILGGVVVKIGSFVIDNSIKTQLSRLYADVLQSSN